MGTANTFVVKDVMYEAKSVNKLPKAFIILTDLEDPYAIDNQQFCEEVYEQIYKITGKPVLNSEFCILDANTLKGLDMKSTGLLKVLKSDLKNNKSKSKAKPKTKVKSNTANII